MKQMLTVLTLPKRRLLQKTQTKIRTMVARNGDQTPMPKLGQGTVLARIRSQFHIHNPITLPRTLRLPLPKEYKYNTVGIAFIIYRL